MEEKTISFKPKVANVKGGRNKKMICLIVILLVIVLAAGGVFAVYKMGYFQAFQMARQLQKQQQVSADDKKILDQLGKMMLLPDGVTPTMALVSDAEALKKDQPVFFANAKNGNHLIIYPDMAILFDAEANKIVKVGAVQFNAAAVTVAVMDGTADGKREPELVKTIESLYGNATITEAGQTVKVYDKTLIVDLTGKNADLKDFATKIGGDVSTLPAGEKAPDGAQILVIVGEK